MPGLEQFPRRERLTQKRDFAKVFETGRKRVGPAFVCYMARREGQGRKLGLAVSRKVGSAVVRNRVKRFIREIYRTQRAPNLEDLYVVVVARPEAAKLNYSQCRDAIRRLLNAGDPPGDA